MKRKWGALLACFVLTLLLPCLTQTAHAGDLDEIVQYDVAAVPSGTDGSLDLTVTVDWKVLDQGPVSWVKIGIPNGNVADIQALTSSIKSLSSDSSYMYVYFDRSYQNGETVHFSYRWTQTYMYTLNGSQVSYEYTPGWFDEAKVDQMTLTWTTPAGVTGGQLSAVCKGAQNWKDNTAGSVYTVTASGLSHSGRITLSAAYPSWPTALAGDMSAANMPADTGTDNGGSHSDLYGAISTIVILVVVLVLIMALTAAARHDAWAGGFGTRYVFVNGLYYPRGADGLPRPGSVGTPHRPAPPPGFGSGRGGGFGGGGFGGGGGHCACASSCACACACACAGGGRAGCSAKNLYGAIHLPAPERKRANG